jgi:hypothetical protein
MSHFSHRCNQMSEGAHRLFEFGGSVEIRTRESNQWRTTRHHSTRITDHGHRKEVGNHRHGFAQSLGIVRQSQTRINVAGMLPLSTPAVDVHRRQSRARHRPASSRSTLCKPMQCKALRTLWSCLTPSFANDTHALENP